MTTPQIIGWRENVGLPDLGIGSLNVKIDTGARTSALHAHVIDVREIDGVKTVEFHLLNMLSKPKTHHLLPIFDKRAVKNTSGIPEERYIIKTRLILGKRLWPIQVSLTDRSEMTYDMILGRKAVRQRNLVINPGDSYLAGEPQQRRNL